MLSSIWSVISKPLTLGAISLAVLVLTAIISYNSNAKELAELKIKDEVRIEVDKIEKKQDLVQEEIIDRKRDMVQFEKELPEKIEEEIENVKKDHNKSYFITADDANNSL